MVCGATCTLGSAFLAGFLLTSIYSRTKGEGLSATLSPQQAAIYDQIKQERKKLALQGLLLGAALSALYVIYNRVKANSGGDAGTFFPQRGKATKPIELVCTVIAITLATTYFYYILSPKSDYMVRYLNPNQLDLYLEKSRGFQLRFTGGLLLGALGSYVLGKGLGC